MFDNLKTALSPHLKADFMDVVITPGVFTIKLCEMNVESQVYCARQTSFAEANPKFKLNQELFNALFRSEITADTIKYLTEVLIVDWSLTDDTGKAINYTPATARKMFKQFPNLATRLIRAAQQGDQFTREWTQEALKN